MGYSTKNPNREEGGVNDILFWTPPLPPGIFHFFIFYFTLGNSRKNKAQPLDIPQNCVRFLGNSKATQILGHPWKFHFILVNPSKFQMLLIWYPSKFHIHNVPLPHPPCLDFFVNSPMFFITAILLFWKQIQITVISK